ncbi:MAG: hypothetical protein EPN57_14425 [Paraburkholderia sp.]|nr:MAG: hypothetical protein EPN57_14425 [Paraburkholderia sp.]
MRTVTQLIALALLATLSLFLWEGRAGLNLPDGGFFWYGVQRVLSGEVPIRDFQAYDPGRYYWSAALLAATHGTSIVALRVTAAIFSWIGVFAGVWLVARSMTAKTDRTLWLLAAVSICAWMTPWFKVFDNTLAILLICGFAYLLRRPSARGYFVAGLCVGFAAVFGRNHGVYGLAASIGAVAYLALQMRRLATLKELGAGVLGVVAGFSPLLVMLLIPGFGSAFWDSIRLIFHEGATNFPLPVPFPWRVPTDQMPLGALLGVLFLWIIAFPMAGLVCAAINLRSRAWTRPEFVAALLVSVPYAHYAYSRADVDHMAVSITPVLVGCFIALARSSAPLRYLLAAALLAISILVVGPSHPGWACHQTQCAVTTVGTDKLQVVPGTAKDVALLNKLVHDFAPNGKPFYVTPYWPGAYALFDQKSPTWAIYALWPRTEGFQQRENEKIAAAQPGFVLINDLPLDGREGQRFSQTNSLTYTYIKTHYRLLTGYGVPDGYELYLPR